MSIKTKLLLIVGGAFVGFINGFLGAGGGIIVVPLLQLVLKESVKVSHATAIFIILPLCIVSSLTYLIGGVFDYKVFIPSLAGSIIGALIGTIALAKFKSNVIVYIFSILIIFAGIEILVL
ncbi:MAG: sulfite exporter TauE/SafE family protein [Clostridia bacterium]|nr:sulfite exporter TauE/SafE family protein [Clostridia bacterium]